MKKVLLLVLILIMGGCSSLPKNISMESPIYQTNEVKFYYDLTYKKDGVIYTEQRIFNQMEKIIKDADKFIILDVFLFNNIYDTSEYNFPAVSDKLTKALIEKKKSNPKIKIYFITDEINTFYGVYQPEELEELRKAGISVTLTDLTETNGANRIYSGFWSTFFRWFGTGKHGWLPNPFSPKAPKVTVRSYLKLMNLKGNHRKVLVTEKEAFITSANPHNASGYHSNIGFKVKGDIINSVVNSEKAVRELSDLNLEVPKVNYPEIGDYKVQLLTEGKIGRSLDRDIDATVCGDTIDIGMFYLGDRKVIKKLIAASKRGVKIKLVLDENKEAFGMKKTGIPNKLSAKEMIDKSDGKIKVRWYASSGEQYHTKIIFIKTKEKAIITGGSANFTKRNIRDYTLDTDIRVEAKLDSKLVKDIESYYTKIWNDKNISYEIGPVELEKNYIRNRILNGIQNISGFSTY